MAEIGGGLQFYCLLYSGKGSEEHHNRWSTYEAAGQGGGCNKNHTSFSLILYFFLTFPFVLNLLKIKGNLLKLELGPSSRTRKF